LEKESIALKKGKKLSDPENQRIKRLKLIIVDKGSDQKK